VEVLDADSLYVDLIAAEQVEGQRQMIVGGDVGACRAQT